MHEFQYIQLQNLRLELLHLNIPNQKEKILNQIMLKKEDDQKEEKILEISDLEKKKIIHCHSQQFEK